MQLAESFNTFELINCDVMQMYRGLDISTNKPTSEELKQCPIHMISFLSKESEYSSFDFAGDCHKLVNDIHSRGRIPLLVGGSNMYIRSVIMKDDVLIFDTRFIYLDCSLDVLQGKLLSRIHDMIDRGVIDEFEAFSREIEGIENPDDKFQICGSIGWKEFQLYLKNPNESTLEQSIQNLLIGNRVYARKQISWFYSTWASSISPLIPDSLFSIPFLEEMKFDICKEIVISWIEGKSLANYLVKYQVKEPLRIKDVEFIEHTCEFCKKTLNGENEWKLHLKSKAHHAFKKKTLQSKPKSLSIPSKTSKPIDSINHTKDNTSYPLSFIHLYPENESLF